MSVRCPVCGSGAAGGRRHRLVCAACGLAARCRESARYGRDAGERASLSRRISPVRRSRASLVERIGAGGMGTVYRARDRRRGDQGAAARLRRRPRRDAHAVRAKPRRCDDSSIRCRALFDPGEDSDVAFIVRSQEGRDLAARPRSGG
jgi:hypothetical protein